MRGSIGLPAIKCYHSVAFMYKTGKPYHATFLRLRCHSNRFRPGGEGAAMGLVKQGARVAVSSVIKMLAAVAPTGAPSRRNSPSRRQPHYRIQSKPTLQRHSRLLRSSFADILNHADNVIINKRACVRDFTNVITVKYCRKRSLC